MIALPYILLCFIFIISFIYSQYDKQRLLESKLFIGILFLFFFGLRGYIFTDVFNYMAFWDICPDLITTIKTKFFLTAWWEPGFVLYTSFFKTFTDNYLVFQFFDTLVNFLLLLKTLKWFKSNNGLTFILLISMSGLLMFIDTIRNIKAILIFMISLRYIYERKLFPFLLCCFLGISFHVSAALYIPFYFFYNFSLTRKKIIILSMISAAFFLFGLSFWQITFNLLLTPLGDSRIGEMINIYIFSDTSYSEGRKLSLGLLEKLLTMSLILINFEKIYEGKNKLIVNSFIFYFAVYFAFSSFHELSHRASMLFIFSYWLLFPVIYNAIGNKNLKILFLLCILAYSILKCSQYSQPFQSYDNILFDYESFSEREKLL